MNPYEKKPRMTLGGLGVYMDAAPPPVIEVSSTMASTGGANGPAQNPAPQVSASGSDQSIAVKALPNGCSWYQEPGPQGCQFSLLRSAQSAFNLPSQIVADPLGMLPTWLVPWVSLGINIATWYFVGGWAAGMVKSEWKKRRG